MEIDFEELWTYVSAPFARRMSSFHGPEHWRRVERNGLLLCTRTQADDKVVRLSRCFMTVAASMTGGPEHGARGAEYAASLRGTRFQLGDDEFELLHYACVWHTDGVTHDNTTIATCWDADRLDLGRVGITPDSKRMCTAFGRELAAGGSVKSFHASSRHAR